MCLRCLTDECLSLSKLLAPSLCQLLQMCTFVDKLNNFKAAFEEAKI